MGEAKARTSDQAKRASLRRWIVEFAKKGRSHYERLNEEDFRVVFPGGREEADKWAEPKRLRLVSVPSSREYFFQPVGKFVDNGQI